MKLYSVSMYSVQFIAIGFSPEFVSCNLYRTLNLPTSYHPC